MYSRELVSHGSTAAKPDFFHMWKKNRATVFEMATLLNSLIFEHFITVSTRNFETIYYDQHPYFQNANEGTASG